MDDRIPIIVNREAGTADEAARILAALGGFDVHEVPPAAVRETALALVAAKPRRIGVCGGDGSISTVAQAVAHTGIELAIVPGGTLNHLAKYLGVPDDLRAAAELVTTGQTRPLDAASLNGRYFLNTSSVGAYEVFVRRRDRLEGRWGYTIASLIAGLRILIRTPTLRITVQVDGRERVYRTPLAFVGVGERELRIPSLGGRMDHGQRGLHLMIVRTRTGARFASLAIQAAARGVKAVARTPAMDSLVVDRCTIDVRHDTASVDGELIAVESPLEYRYHREALTVVIGERRGAQRANL